MAVDKSNSGVCARVTTLQSTNEAEIATHIATLQSNFAARLAKIASDKTAIDQKITTARANTNQQFEAKIQKLESKAGLTNTQKLAIEVYKLSMEQAEKTRETAVDNARLEYRSNLNYTVTSRQLIWSDSAALFQTNVKTAFSAASAKCSDGSADTMTTLKAAIQDAHQTLTTARSDAKLSSDIKQLASTRDKTIKSANDAFIKSVTTYTTTLKSALGE
jgi:hypothetical protein